MTIARHSSPLTVLCLTLAIAWGGAVPVQAGGDLLNGLNGGGAASARGNDGVGGIERETKPASGPGNTGPGLPQNGGLITPVAPTPPPSGSSNDVTVGGWLNLGFDLPGATTSPALELVLGAQAEAALSLLVTGGLPGNDVFIIAGTQQLPTSFKGGVLVPSPDVLITGLSLDERGQLVVPLAMIERLPPLMLLYVQAWMPDQSNLLGFSATNAIAVVVP